MFVRQSQVEDLAELQRTFAAGRLLQRRLGNFYQWPNDYPQDDLLLADIASGNSFVVVADDQEAGLAEPGIILATFYIHEGENPAFRYSPSDMWVNQASYVTLHRICTNQQVKGTGRFCFEWITQHYDNVRLYTHRTNIPMINLAENYGFKNCGEFSIGEIELRLGYQYVKGVTELV